jgi:hypothetical protein
VDRVRVDTGVRPEVCADCGAENGRTSERQRCALIVVQRTAGRWSVGQAIIADCPEIRGGNMHAYGQVALLNCMTPHGISLHRSASHCIVLHRIASRRIEFHRRAVQRMPSRRRGLWLTRRAAGVSQNADVLLILCIVAVFVVLCCCIAILLCRCVAVLLFWVYGLGILYCCSVCVAVLLYCYIAMTLCCCAAVLLCCSYVVLLCCCAVCVYVVLFCCIAMLLC